MYYMDAHLDFLARERGGFYLLAAMVRSPQDKQHRGIFYQDRKTFPSDNEGVKLWPQIHDVTDTVNIMAYDAANITFDFKTILDNFVAGGVSKEKINLGFEPGNQRGHSAEQQCPRSPEVDLGHLRATVRGFEHKASLKHRCIQQRS